MVVSTARLLIFAVLALVVCTGLAEAQKPTSIEASLNRDTIGLDEQAILQVIVSGNEADLPAPQLPTLPKFQVYNQGRSSNIRVVNNEMHVSITYRYLLMPTAPGTYPINNISVVHRNKRYAADNLELTVLDQGQAPSQQLPDPSASTSSSAQDYFLVATVDKTNPYVNEQVTLTLKFHIAVQYYTTPELTQPPTTGFWTEMLGNRAPYYQKINGRNYQVLEVKYALFPTQTGELTIGRALIRTTVASKHRSQRRSIFDNLMNRGDEITVRSKPIVINVRPIPSEGRPANFTGTIGRFDIAAHADKREVEVNQPVTVTIEITGVGNVKSVAEPTIGDLPDFRVYRSSSSESVNKLDDRIGGTKMFEEVFIPRRPGELTIPSLEFTYFNPRTERFETKETRPITIRATGAEGYAGGNGTPYSPPGVSIGSEASDIRYIKQDMGDLRRSGNIILTSPLYVIVNGVPVLVMVGLIVARVRRERLSRDVGYARSRAALKVARKRLATAGGMATVDRTADFYAELHRAVTSYLADKLNMSPHGLTGERIASLLTERGADGDLVNETTEFLEQCDFARFAPATIGKDDIDQALDRAEKLIVRMEGIRLG
ncbi:hypothetical protein GF420_06390 [candidate division GN15 bacterium]|nr:hypothetical protein [candidate division GN15 bacterium]